MLTDSPAFSGFSVSNIDEAKEFYEKKLGLKTSLTPEGLQLHLGGEKSVFVYPKPNHVPAEFTVLNFPVLDIAATVTELIASGIVMEKYSETHQDEQGIAWGRIAGFGPNIAWFKDPSGNIFSVLQ